VHAALRPYMTTGIAIVGASVIAVAPVTVPPPELPSVKVAAVDTVRSVTADVQLTLSAGDLGALANALVNAIGPAVSETVKLYTQTIPTSAVGLIATGKFAHLPVLVANSVFLGAVTPVAPFLVALRDNLPLPIGTDDGLINEGYKLFVNTPVTAGLTILSLVADVFDSGLSPYNAFVSTLNTLSTAIPSAVESLGKIVAALTGGALPFSALAAKASVQNARTVAAAVEGKSPEGPDVVPASVNPSGAGHATDTVTVALDSPTPADTSTAVGESEGKSDQPQHANKDDETANGGTDLSDGNQAKPGETGGGSAQKDDDGSTTVTEVKPANTEPAGKNAGTATDDTGSDEGSGDDKGSSE
jgi:hypothetical protein